MSKFSLILSGHVSSTTDIKVFELCRNGESLFEKFVKKVTKDHISFGRFAGAIKIVEHSANGIRLPKTKFRVIKAHGLPCKVFEAKKDDIRIYMFHEENTGRVIVTGAYKDTQEKDIKAVIRIVKSYYHEKK